MIIKELRTKSYSGEVFDSGATEHCRRSKIVSVCLNKPTIFPNRVIQ